MGPDACPDCAGYWRNLEDGENRSMDDMLGNLTFGDANPTGNRHKCADCGLVLVELRSEPHNTTYVVMFGGRGNHAGAILR